MGTKVVEVRPPQGFGSEAVAATVILASSHAGYPLSTYGIVTIACVIALVAIVAYGISLIAS